MARQRFFVFFDDQVVDVDTEYRVEVAIQLRQKQTLDDKVVALFGLYGIMYIFKGSQIPPRRQEIMFGMIPDGKGGRIQRPAASAAWVRLAAGSLSKRDKYAVVINGFQGARKFISVILGVDFRQEPSAGRILSQYVVQFVGRKEKPSVSPQNQNIQAVAVEIWNDFFCQRAFAASPEKGWTA